MKIRSATVNDATGIAPLLFHAMEDIIYQFIGERSEAKGIAFLRYFVALEGNQYSYQNCIVAEEENRIVAAVNFYDGALLYQLRQPVLDYIFATYGKRLLPEDETGPGEHYIDSFGVLPVLRGRGVGSQMLQYLVENIAIKGGHTLGLLVEQQNSSASRLYQRTGFKVVGTKTFLGKTMDHLQFIALPNNSVQ